MTTHVDIWLRGTDVATTHAIEGLERDPASWTDEDVRFLLEEMLRSMHRAKNPESSERAVSLRGLSWIVNPFEEGGVVIAIEITLGAAIAGPFAIDQRLLESMVTRVLAGNLPPSAHVP